MRYTWNRAFADGREAALAGEGPDRLLGACHRLLFEGADPGALVEMPLLGKPEYDFLLVLHGGQVRPGCRLHDPAQTRAQAVVDWLASLRGPRPDAFLEMDASGGGKLAGVHAKVEGRRDLAEGFFGALGEPMRAEHFRNLADRLPEDWLCLYVAAFPGRPQGTTRLEVMPTDEQARATFANADRLGDCLERIGLAGCGCDDSMLAVVARLAAIGTPITMQLDLLPDGSLAPTLSLVSSYEHARDDVRSLWRPNGDLARTCLVYEELGLSDGRWRRLEDGCFMARRTTLDSGIVKQAIHSCLPACTKLTWIDGAWRKAKIYVSMGLHRLF